MVILENNRMSIIYLNSSDFLRSLNGARDDKNTCSCLLKKRQKNRQIEYTWLEDQKGEKSQISDFGFEKSNEIRARNSYRAKKTIFSSGMATALDWGRYRTLVWGAKDTNNRLVIRMDMTPIHLPQVSSTHISQLVQNQKETCSSRYTSFTTKKVISNWY